MALGVNGLNQNIFVRPAETVSGSELSKVAGEILAARAASPANNASSLLSSLTTGRNNVELSLFGRTASSDTNAIRFAAANTAKLDIELSQKTQAAVNALNAQAAGNLVKDIANTRNGMIHINIEKPDFTGLKNTFALSDSPQVFQSMNLSKDRRGPSPFVVPKAENKKSENEDGLNIIA